MGKMFIVASGKGGTGKTTVVSHVGAALAKRGHLVVLVDADAGFRNLDLALGLESSIVYDYSDHINGDSALDDILIKSPVLQDMYFVAAPQSVAASDLDEEKTALFWQSLKNRFDYVLADAPAGMGDGFLFAAKYADEAIIVSLAETSSLRDADRVISALEELGKENIRLILNRIDPGMIERKIMMNVDDCTDVLGVPILGIIPEDRSVAESMLRGAPLIEDEAGGAGTAFRNIAERLEGKPVPIMEFNSGEGHGLIGRIRSALKRRKQ